MTEVKYMETNNKLIEGKVKEDLKKKESKISWSI